MEGSVGVTEICRKVENSGKLKGGMELPRCVVVKRDLPCVDNKIVERPVKDEIKIIFRIKGIHKTDLDSTRSN